MKLYHLLTTKKERKKGKALPSDFLLLGEQWNMIGVSPLT